MAVAGSIYEEVKGMRKKSLGVFLPIVLLLFGYLVTSSALDSQTHKTVSSYGIIRYGARALHTDGRDIKDEAGNVVLLRGVARGETSYAFSSDYQGWYKHHEVERDYDRLKSLGVNIVRLALNPDFWINHATLPNIDGVVTEYVQLVDDIVSWCGSKGIYLMLEHHPDISQAEKAQIFVDPTNWINWLVELATRYKNQSHVSISIMSEPPGHGYCPPPYNTREACSARWREIASMAIEAIRAVNPNVLIWVDPAGFVGASLIYDFSGKHLPYSNIVYNMHHYYHSDLGSLVGKDYPPEPYAVDYWNGNLVVAKQEYEQFLLDYGWKLLAENVPVVVTEFGVWYPDNNWDVQIRDFYDLCRKYGVSWMQWWWHGYWSVNPATIDYHLLKEDWQTLSPIGEIFMEELENHQP